MEEFLEYSKLVAAYCITLAVVGIFSLLAVIGLLLDALGDELKNVFKR